MLLLEKICECSNDTTKCCSTVKETPNQNKINTEPNMAVGFLIVIFTMIAMRVITRVVHGK